jgi:hypothetical protein
MAPVVRGPTVLILSLALCLIKSAAAAQTDEIINFEHIDRAEFAIHVDWLALDNADQETLVRAVYEEYIESAKDLEQSWLLVLDWSGRWRLDGSIDLAGPGNQWVARLSILGDWQGYWQFVADEIEKFEQQYFDDLRALLPDRAATIERLERLRHRSVFFRPKRSIYFRDTPDIVLLVNEIAPNLTDDAAALELIIRHEREMERLLTDFEAAQQRQMAEWGAAIETADAPLIADLMRDPFIVRMHMRDLTRRTAAAVEPYLDVELRDELRQRMDESMYPGLTRGWPGADMTLLSATSTAGHLLRQLVLTPAERARLEAILAAVDARRNEALPDLRRRYDDMFTREAIDESAESRAAAYVGSNPQHTAFGEWSWYEWATEVHTGFDAEIAEIRAIAVAVGERPAPTDAAPPPEVINDGSMEPLWLPSATLQQIDEAMTSLGLDDDVASQVREIARSFRHLFTLESLRMRVAMGSSMSHFEATLGADTAEARQRSREMRLSLDERWVAFRRDSESEFVESVASVLAPEPAGKWRAMHAQWRRAQLLAYIRQRLQPGAIDLSVVLDEAAIGVANDPELAACISEYATELDRLIERAVNEYPKRWAEYLRIQEREGQNAPATEAARARAGDLGAALVQLNERELPRMLGLLEEADAARFQEALARRLYPTVFQESPAERLRVLFGKVDDLREDQLSALDAIFDGVEAREMGLRRRIVEAIEQWASPSNQDWVQRRQQELIEMGEHPYRVFDEHPALPLFEQESQMVAQAVRGVRRVFTNDEFEALPPQIRILTFWVD